MLRIKYKSRPRRLSGTYGPGGGPEARMQRMRALVTALIRHERIEATWQKCDESRGYAERLIEIAIRNGDKDAKTMELADYWLLDKDLVHKLFKVLVPRYKNYSSSYTALHRLPNVYGGIEPHLHPGPAYPMGILELKGNIWPPVKPKVRNTRHLLSNVLLRAFREDYMREQKAQQKKNMESVAESKLVSESDTDIDSDSAGSLTKEAKNDDLEQVSKEVKNLDLSSQSDSDKSMKKDS